jgi:hypothetical protein
MNLASKAHANIVLRALIFCFLAESAAWAQFAIQKAQLTVTATRYIDGGGLRTVVVPLYVSAPQTPGTYPLIVWSHGGLSTAQNIELVDYWAEQGYITVAPAHLDSVEQRDAGASAGFPTTGNTWSFVNRAADVSMVLDEIAAIATALNQQTGGGYTIAADRPVVGGHSFGAFTAMAVTGAKWVREITGGSISSDTLYSPSVIADGTVLEERFVGGIYVASAGTEQGYGLYNFNLVDVPFLGINGTADSGPPSNPFPSGYLDRLDVFTSSAGDGIGADDGVNDDGQYMVVFQDAGHTSFLGKADRYDPDVREITLRFLDGIAKGNTAALEPLHDPVAYKATRPEINQLLVRPYAGGGPVFAKPFILLPPVGPDGAVNATLAGTADGNGQAVTYAKTSGPAWLAIAPDGTVSGTPTAADEGIHDITVTATTAGGSATATAQIWVTTPPSDAILPQLAMDAGPSGLNLEMTRLMGGYTYGLETSPNLESDSWRSLANVPVPLGASAVDIPVSREPGQDRGFFRAKRLAPGPDFFDGDLLYADLNHYVALGDHRTGGPGDRRTVDWLAEELRLLGFQVTRTRHSVRQYFVEEATCVLNGQPIEVFPLWWPEAGQWNLTAPLADSAASSPNPRIAVVVLSGSGGAGIAPGSTDFNLVNGAIQSGASAVIAITPAESGELVGLNPIGSLADWPIPVLLTGAKTRTCSPPAPPPGRRRRSKYRAPIRKTTP